MDKISIITVTYNAVATLESTIKSVIAQTFPNIEFIIIDGASSDGTINIIKQYQSHLSFWQTAHDNGIYDAMNKGIAKASGKWVYFLGADDVFTSNTVLDKIFGEDRSYDEGFLYGNMKLSSSGKILGGSRDYQQLIQYNIGHQAIFYNRQILDKFDGYDTRYKILSDYDLNLRIFEDVTVKKLYLPVTICLFNDKGTSNNSIDSAFFRDKLKQLSGTQQVKRQRKILQKYNFYHGFVLLLRDKKLRGLSLCLKAFSSGPRKFYYLLVFCKFMLSRIGIGNKIKIV